MRGVFWNCERGTSQPHEIVRRGGSALVRFAISASIFNCLLTTEKDIKITAGVEHGLRSPMSYRDWVAHLLQRISHYACCPVCNPTTSYLSFMPLKE
jgi:hypothetical protein